MLRIHIMNSSYLIQTHIGTLIDPLKEPQKGTRVYIINSRPVTGVSPGRPDRWFKFQTFGAHGFGFRV